MREAKIAGLTVHTTDDKLCPGGRCRGAVVLLHGFGAPGTDLVSLADDLRVPEGTVLLFPEAPLDLSAIMGTPYANARAWWPINMTRVQLEMHTGQAERAIKELSRGMDSACRQLVALIDEIQFNLRLDPDKIVLGGFSQGAIASLEVALQDRRTFAGLILMSATLVNTDRLVRAANQHSGTRVILSHGYADPILPFELADALRQELEAAKWEVTWVPFAGGHTIPKALLEIQSTMLQQWLT